MSAPASLSDASKSVTPYLSSSNIWPGQFLLPSKDERIRQHSVLFCVTLDPICCNMQAYNKMKANNLVSSSVKNPKGVLVCNLAVLVPASAGFSKAPYEGRNLPSSQMLSQINLDEDFGRELLVYGFDKHSSDNNEYRGDFRPDVCALVRTGCTLKVMIGMHTFNPKFASMFDADVAVIPPFTVVEVTLKSGNTKGIGEEEIKGSFCKISKISVMNNTLMSFTTHLKPFPTSFDRQKGLTEGCRDFTKYYDNNQMKQVPVASMIYGNGGDCALITDVSTSLVCQPFTLEELEVDEFSIDQVGLKAGVVKLNNVSGESFEGECIKELDIETHLVQRYTNCQDVDRACKLLEVAASLKALSIFCVKKYTFNNIPATKKRMEKLAPCRGVPIVNFQKILGIQWRNGQMVGLNEFLDALRKQDFKGDLGQSYGQGEDEVRIEFKEGMIFVRHTNRFHIVEDVKRSVYVVIDPIIRLDPVDDVPWSKISVDNQLIHKSVKLPKYCRITINLGGPVKEGAEENEEDEGIQNFVCLKMNLSVSAMVSFFGNKESDSNKVTLKRKRITEEDADDGFSD